MKDTYERVMQALHEIDAFAARGNSQDLSQVVENAKVIATSEYTEFSEAEQTHRRLGSGLR